MLEIEAQLRRYGEEIERELLGRGEGTPLVGERRARRSRRVLVMAAVLVVVVAGVVIALIGAVDDDGAVVSTEPAAPTEQPRAGVFSTPTNTVLLFSDGIDGATAIDLDRRLAGRRVIEGERAGDQPFRLTLTDNRLVVGWGEIYAAPLSGGPSAKVADATIYIPASEPGEVWTRTWAGGRIGAGAETLRRVRLDGTVAFTAPSFDSANLHPVLGVPGGLMVDTPDGVAVWDAASGATGPILGPGPATAVTSNGRSLAWCASTCSTVNVAPLDRTGSPTAAHVAPGRQQIALSRDGTHLAFIRPTGVRAELVLVDQSTGDETIVAGDVDQAGSLQWTSDGRQLFYTENSYVQPSMRVGRYEVGTNQWEIQTLPVGDGLAAIALDRSHARSFFSERLVPADECRGAGGSYPSGRQGVCAFAFFTPDSPDECVADGPNVIDVPDAVGLLLSDAQIRMQAAGLNVVETGTPSGDPTGAEAVVRSQEPPAGSRVPAGACVGFRTSG